jgi:rhodanese-related sulfurtransferase
MSSLQVSPPLRRIFLEALVLCALAVSVGLSLNFRLVLNAFSGKTVSLPAAASREPGLPQSAAGTPLQRFPEPVELGELDELLAGGALLVDARNSFAYAERHLPGAVSLPLGEVDVRLDQFLAETPRELLLITYCTGFGCPDSFDLGVRLLAAGYREVLVFEGGVPQWRDAGRPLEGEK